MKRVLLDTNFLLIPGDFSVDIFTELRRVIDGRFQVCVLEATLDELERLSNKGKGRLKRSALLGLQLLRDKGVLIVPSERNVDADSVLVDIAVPGIDIVATQDKELKARLMKKHIGVIVLRKKKYLNAIET
jgi:uncharacterized protein